ncbi:MAG TPA: methylenetetrahydrofolate--tRNA-(uracil(54)-C(5))-methyltransferase (FADH(2)-oxidizing) TrmFO [Candidatus Krumholzibacteria bacterium]|nr:methylenetetrahydrofolate--tRNA-(uracil(54)-C(5))-methyltransferase (FADH(2)-oxidizing) TrmFO [Candidatus Krumholzibacteria bacterium]
MGAVTIVGGGLAGCEAALQLADRGFHVRLFEMRPETATGAHKTDRLAEIVCSNSFKSTLLDTASGLLKAEMDALGCRLLPVARENSVPAGHALGIDRDLFSSAVTARVEAHANITIERRRVDSLDLPVPAVVATGPLTAEALSQALVSHCSRDHLYFYDAIAPSIDGSTVDPAVGYWASRYGKGDADYLNIPFSRDEYRRLIEFVRGAEYSQSHAFEEEKYFEACLPIEVLVARGEDTLRFGPMKPKGLPDPRTGRDPYAVLQLRKESREGTLMGLVGFQTRMTWACQKEMLHLLPGCSDVSVLRFGTIHRNIFLDIPTLCDPYLRDRARPGLHFAGQICGVEGYVESIMSAIIVSLSIAAASRGREMPPIPSETMIGSLMDYVHTPRKNFQPMNANFGLLPAGAGGRRNRQTRHQDAAKAAIAAMESYRDRNAWLFE